MSSAVDCERRFRKKITEDDMPDIELSKTEQGKKKLEIIIDEPVASTIFFRISGSANVIKLANSP